MVREIVGTEGWVEAVKPYIQVPTWEALYRKFRRPERADA
jgi:hypothetical protein